MLPPRSTLFPYTTLSRSDFAANDFSGRVRNQAHNRQSANAFARTALSYKAQRLTLFKRIRYAIHCLNNATLSVEDRKSTRLNSSHTVISYAVFCLKKKKS